MSEQIILGSESPDADVLVYDKNKKYNEGVLVDSGNDIIVADDNGTEVELEFEFVYEV